MNPSPAAKRLLAHFLALVALAGAAVLLPLGALLSRHGRALRQRAEPQTVASMAEQCPGQIIYFCTDRNLPLMATHRAQGNRVVYVEDGKLAGH